MSAIFLSLLAGAVIILLLGKNPLSAYGNLLQGLDSSRNRVMPDIRILLTDCRSYMNAWTPMLFASLAVAVGMCAGLFNIGVSGQMLTSGFITTLVIGYSSLPAAVAKPCVLIVGAVVGALIGALIGWLKYKFNINEVVSSIMINYYGPVCDQLFHQHVLYQSGFMSSPKAVSKASRLTLMDTPVGNLKMDIPLGILLCSSDCSHSEVRVRSHRIWL
ncbi:MAG: ABC transporter permease subunit [Clostridium fessum]